VISRAFFLFFPCNHIINIKKISFSGEAKDSVFFSFFILLHKGAKHTYTHTHTHTHTLCMFFSLHMLKMILMMRMCCETVSSPGPRGTSAMIKEEEEGRRSDFPKRPCHSGRNTHSQPSLQDSPYEECTTCQKSPISRPIREQKRPTSTDVPKLIPEFFGEPLLHHTRLLRTEQKHGISLILGERLDRLYKLRGTYQRYTSEVHICTR
jgi:hypothetical protein